MPPIIKHALFLKNTGVSGSFVIAFDFSVVAIILTFALLQAPTGRWFNCCTGFSVMMDLSVSIGAKLKHWEILFLVDDGKLGLMSCSSLLVGTGSIL